MPLIRKGGPIRVRRADLELDVDMESFLEDGAYLWGTYLTGPGVTALGLTPGYRAFVSWRPLPDPDEGRAFAEFWTYLTRLRSLAAENGLTFAAYCYSRSAEERWLRSTPVRYPAVPGMPTPAQIAEFCSSPAMGGHLPGDQGPVPGDRIDEAEGVGAHRRLLLA